MYVCDTWNHALREINLCDRTVCTVVGTGLKGKDKLGGYIPEMQELSSPWDIVPLNRDILLIAMAGSH